MRQDHQTQPVIYRVQRRQAEPRRGGCGGCLSNMFIGSLLLLAVAVLANVAITGTQV